jgi:hypothetical protein
MRSTLRLIGARQRTRFAPYSVALTCVQAGRRRSAEAKPEWLVWKGTPASSRSASNALDWRLGVNI